MQGKRGEEGRRGRGERDGREVKEWLVEGKGWVGEGRKNGWEEKEGRGK